ncbi:MAG: 7-cyano-7-deazaguanine synthase, partial [Candidatus Methylumidiphilus sp.]
MKKALILLSGGLDSATLLALAKQQGYLCHALSFNYGQRHGAELDAARRIAEQAQVAEHKLVHIGLDAFGGSALTDDRIAVPHRPAAGIP